MEVEIINQLGITNPTTFVIITMIAVFAAILLGIWKAGLDTISSTMFLVVAVFIVGIVAHSIEVSNDNKVLAAKILATKDFVIEDVNWNQNSPSSISLRPKTPLTTDIKVGNNLVSEPLPKQLATISIQSLDKINTVLVAHNAEPITLAQK